MYHNFRFYCNYSTVRNCRCRPLQLLLLKSFAWNYEKSLTIILQLFKSWIYWIWNDCIKKHKMRRNYHIAIYWKENNKQKIKFCFTSVKRFKVSRVNCIGNSPFIHRKQINHNLNIKKWKKEIVVIAKYLFEKKIG